MHVAWSGDHTTYAERTPEGECLLGGGELLGPGEVVLARGGDVRLALAGRRLLRRRASTPPAPGSTAGCGGTRRARAAPARCWSTPGRRRTSTTTSTGSTELARRRRRGRRRAVRARRRLVPRPPRTTGPASATGPSTRTSGPRGCTRWSTQVQRLGMDFGLWVEPEMVNEDSDLARAHPDWVLRGRDDAPARRGGTSRCSTSRHPTPTPTCATRCWRLLDGVRHRLPQVGPQPRPDRRRPRRATGRARADAGVLPAARRAAGRPSRPGDRVLRHRRRPDRPRGAHPHRPGLAERHHRRDRAAADPAVDLAAGAAGDARRPPRRAGRPHHRPHAPARVPRRDRAARPLRHRVGPARAGRRRPRPRSRRWVALHKRVRPVLAERHGWSAATTPTPPLLVTGVVAADARRGAGTSWPRSTPSSPSRPAAVLLPGLDPARTYRLTREDPPGDRHVADLGDVLARRRRASRSPGAVLSSAGRPAAGRRRPSRRTCCGPWPSDRRETHRLRAARAPRVTRVTSLRIVRHVPAGEGASTTWQQ